MAREEWDCKGGAHSLRLTCWFLNLLTTEFSKYFTALLTFIRHLYVEQYMLRRIDHSCVYEQCYEILISYAMRVYFLSASWGMFQRRPFSVRLFSVFLFSETWKPRWRPEHVDNCDHSTRDAWLRTDSFGMALTNLVQKLGISENSWEKWDQSRSAWKQSYYVYTSSRAGPTPPRCGGRDMK